MHTDLYIYIFYYFVIFSLMRVAAILLSSNQEPAHLGEKRVRHIVNYGAFIDVFHLLMAIFFLDKGYNFTIQNFLFFGIDFSIRWNALTIAFLCFAIVTMILMTRFSTFYLHRDPYFYKFFSIAYILQVALCLLILTDGNEGIFIGWELLGLSSVLLIAFYEHRTTVLKSSLIILAIYKISDILFYSAIIYGTVHGQNHYTHMIQPVAVFLILTACLIKSSVFPVFWLPRAMEGPTPSSAIFYGGLATHLPVFIFLSVWNNFEDGFSKEITAMIVITILIPIICSNLLSKQNSDAKNALAYSVITQLGIIYLEILFGFVNLAVVHCICHGIYKTLLFLSTPSILYTRHEIEKNRRSIARPIGWHYHIMVPKWLRLWSYRVTYSGFFFNISIMNIIESTLGLYSENINKATIKSYMFFSISFLFLMELFSSMLFHHSITMTDESILLVAYAFNLMALVNEESLRLFFICIFSSVGAALILLLEKTFPGNALYFNILLMIALITIVAISYKNLSSTLGKDNQGSYFIRKINKSSSLSLLFLFLGFSIIGIPGLGTFYIWERLEHHLIFHNPELILDSFVLLSLNSIVFFRFYYANFLGKKRILSQYIASTRT